MSDDTVWKPTYTDEETTDVRESRHMAEIDGGDFASAPTVEQDALIPDEADPDGDAVDLFHDPFHDDLNAKLIAAGPRQLANRATMIFAALVILVVGFVVGAQVQKSYGTSATASGTGRAFPTGAFPSGAAAGGFGRGGYGFGGGTGTGTGGGTGTGTRTAGDAITGTVKLVDGNTIYVEEADGTVVTVNTSGSTTVLTPGALKDLAAGNTVTVQGTNNNGTVTASSISKTK